jgi:hypothetical protein
MEAVWGAVLSFLFVLATLSGYNLGGPSTSEQKEQIEKQQKEMKEQFEKDQKEWKEQLEKQKEQREKSGKKENSDKKGKSTRADKSAAEKESKQKSDPCTGNCPDEWRFRQ